MSLPPSLAVTPNIPWEAQTLEQLEAERAHWEAEIASATAWGAGVAAADGFRRGCIAWIARRRLEQSA